MKRTVRIAFFFLLSVCAFAQSPQQINFQGVLRELSGTTIKNQSVTITVSFTTYNVGTLRYRETHVTSTDDFGMIHLTLGTGTPVSGSFQDIQWDAEQISFSAEATIAGGVTIQIEEQRFVSVPYALHANTANTLAGPNDTDVTNELNQSLVLSGTVLRLDDAGGQLTVDLETIDDQTLALNNKTLTISGGNSINLQSLVDNDSLTTNELNTAFELSGSTLSITDAGAQRSVDLSPINTDQQTLSFSGSNILSIQNGNQVDLSSLEEDADANPQNEIQHLSIEGSTISLSGSDAQVNITALGAEADDQNASQVPFDGVPAQMDADDVQEALVELAAEKVSSLQEAYAANSLITLDGTHELRVNTSTGTPLLSTNNTGRVGIGTTTSDATLEIRSSEPNLSGRLQISNQENDHRLNLFSGRADNPYSVIAAASGDALAFGHYSAGVLAERIRIASNGNVGIGTVTPLGKMHVTGTTSEMTGPLDQLETIIGNSIEAGAVFQFTKGSDQGINAGVASTISGTGTNYGMIGSSLDDNGNLNRGVYGAAAGGNTENAGVIGFGYGSSPENVGIKGIATGSSNNYGAQAFAQGAGTYNYGLNATGTGATTANYGVYAEAAGSATTNHGIYAAASGGTTNWAGYFQGNVRINGQINVNGSPLATHRNYELANDNYSIGNYSLGSISSGSGNVAYGFGTLNNLTTGNSNVALGYRAMEQGVAGNDNIALGSHAQFNATGSNNISVGKFTLGDAAGGSGNVGIGTENLRSIVNGQNNVSLGYLNSRSVTTGNNNIALGTFALDANTTGTDNIAIGYSAGTAIVNNTHNIAIGTNSNIANNANRAVAIGHQAVAGQNDAIVLGNPYDASVRVGIGTSTPEAKLHVIGDVLVSGSVAAENIASPSDRRLKTNITPIDDAVRTISQLEGVSYFWKKDNPENARKQYGLIAQELEKVIPDLVHTNAEGFKSVNYTSLIPFLLEAIKTQQQEIEILKEQNDLLKASVDAKLEALTTMVKTLAASMNNSQTQQTVSTDAKK